MLPISSLCHVPLTVFNIYCKWYVLSGNNVYSMFLFIC
jgi:hypothetical protein